MKFWQNFDTTRIWSILIKFWSCTVCSKSQTALKTMRSKAFLWASRDLISSKRLFWIKLRPKIFVKPLMKSMSMVMKRSITKIFTLINPQWESWNWISTSIWFKSLKSKEISSTIQILSLKVLWSNIITCNKCQAWLKSSNKSIRTFKSKLRT